MKGAIRFTDIRKVYRWRGRRSRHETLKGAVFHRRLSRRTAEANGQKELFRQAPLMVNYVWKTVCDAPLAL